MKGRRWRGNDSGLDIDHKNSNTAGELEALCQEEKIYLEGRKQKSSSFPHRLETGAMTWPLRDLSSESVLQSRELILCSVQQSTTFNAEVKDSMEVPRIEMNLHLR